MVRRPVSAFFVCLISAFAQPALPRLDLGKPITNTIRTGEVQRLALEAPTASFVRASIRQEGIGVRVRGFFPDGSKIRNFAGPNTGVKNLRFVIEMPGVYELELTGLGAGNPEGRYTLVLEQVQPMAERSHLPLPDPFVSPRIQSLAQADSAALARFWEEITRTGAPLVENIATDSKHLLVTFLWRATFETHNVLVLWNPYASEHPEDFAMRRLGSTDLWYKTLRLPKGAKFVYQLSPNDTLSRSPNAQRYATAQADPLNPRRQPIDPNLTKYETRSEVELPGGTPEPWIAKRPSAPAGTLYNHQVAGRTVTVYTPPGYRRDGPLYPALLLFDGKTYQTEIPVPVILDNLIDAKEIAPVIAVFIDASSPERREDEFFGNAAYTSFVADELMPWAARQYRIAATSDRNLIGGLSAGGFAAAFIALRHPAVFGKVLCQSGAFWWSPNLANGEERGGLIREYAAAPARNLKFFLEAGLFENDVVGVGGQILEHNRHLRDVLRAKGYEVHYHEFPGGHDRMNWRASFPDALIWLAEKP